MENGGYPATGGGGAEEAAAAPPQPPPDDVGGGGLEAEAVQPPQPPPTVDEEQALAAAEQQVVLLDTAGAMTMERPTRPPPTPTASPPAVQAVPSTGGAGDEGPSVVAAASDVVAPAPTAPPTSQPSAPEPPQPPPQQQQPQPPQPQQQPPTTTTVAGLAPPPPSQQQQQQQQAAAPTALANDAAAVPRAAATTATGEYPMKDIHTPHAHDVLCGRGGGTNNHPGNESFRDLVNEQKRNYLNSTKREKPLVSRRIVEAVRCQKPPGRFLSKNDQTGLWYDIGDQKAREKTSQALREGAPVIRREISQTVGVGVAQDGAGGVVSTSASSPNGSGLPQPPPPPPPGLTSFRGLRPQNAAPPPRASPPIVLGQQQPHHPQPPPPPGVMGMTTPSVVDLHREIPTVGGVGVGGGGLLGGPGPGVGGGTGPAAIRSLRDGPVVGGVARRTSHVLAGGPRPAPLGAATVSIGRQPQPHQHHHSRQASLTGRPSPVMNGAAVQQQLQQQQQQQQQWQQQQQQHQQQVVAVPPPQPGQMTPQSSVPTETVKKLLLGQIDPKVMYQHLAHQEAMAVQQQQQQHQQQQQQASALSAAPRPSAPQMLSPVAPPAAMGGATSMQFGGGRSPSSAVVSRNGSIQTRSLGGGGAVAPPAQLTSPQASATFPPTPMPTTTTVTTMVPQKSALHTRELSSGQPATQPVDSVAGLQSIAERWQKQSVRSKAPPPLPKGARFMSQPPPLPKEVTHRLNLSERMTQSAADGTATEELKKAERQAAKFHDAGLLGISLAEAEAALESRLDISSVIDDFVKKRNQSGKDAVQEGEARDAPAAANEEEPEKDAGDTITPKKEETAGEGATELHERPSGGVAESSPQKDIPDAAANGGKKQAASPQSPEEGKGVAGTAEHGSSGSKKRKREACADVKDESDLQGSGVW